MLRYARVHGFSMAYREAGDGDPVVFVHGNPTSSYLWRDVPGRVAGPRRRCLAPDLVGMGASDKVPGSGPGSYRFVERVLPAGTRRALTEEEHDAYRAPYRDPGEGRRPTLTWPREIPIDGVPADVAGIVADNAAFTAASPVPKLFVNGDPGALLVGPAHEGCRTWPEQTEVTVPGLHFLPEDAAPEIAAPSTPGWRRSDQQRAGRAELVMRRRWRRTGAGYPGGRCRAVIRRSGR